MRKPSGSFSVELWCVPGDCFTTSQLNQRTSGSKFRNNSETPKYPHHVVSTGRVWAAAEGIFLPLKPKSNKSKDLRMIIVISRHCPCSIFTGSFGSVWFSLQLQALNGSMLPNTGHTAFEEHPSAKQRNPQHKLLESLERWCKYVRHRSEGGP